MGNWAIASLAAIFVYKNVAVPDPGALGIASFPDYLNIKGGKILWGVALIVAAVLDSRAMEQMIDIVNSSLAFLLPFALVPLTRLTTSKQFMGDRFVSGWIEAIAIWVATFCCFGINFYTLVAPGGDYFGKYTSKPGASGVQMNIIQDILAAFYIARCVYMAFAPVKGAPLPISKD